MALPTVGLVVGSAAGASQAMASGVNHQPTARGVLGLSPAVLLAVCSRDGPGSPSSLVWLWQLLNRARLGRICRGAQIHAMLLAAACRYASCGECRRGARPAFSPCCASIALVARPRGGRANPFSISISPRNHTIWKSHTRICLAQPTWQRTRRGCACLSASWRAHPTTSTLRWRPLSCAR